MHYAFHRAAYSLLIIQLKDSMAQLNTFRAEILLFIVYSSSLKTDQLKEEINWRKILEGDSRDMEQLREVDDENDDDEEEGWSPTAVSTEGNSDCSNE